MRKFLAIVFFSLLIIACDNTPIADPIPFKIVNKLIDLNNFRYQRLKFDRGFVYEEGGSRGMIIYRQNASSYLVFDRHCPYRTTDACGQVNVDGSGLFMRDSCCSSVFDFDGRPISGPAFNAMLRYRASLSGSLLSINN